MGIIGARRGRRSGGAAGAVVALAISLVVPGVASGAAALSPGGYLGTASAVGAAVDLGGQGLTIGFTDAGVQSEVPDAPACAAPELTCARAAGELLLGETAQRSSPSNEGVADATAFELSDIAAALDMVALLQLGAARAEAVGGTAPLATGDAGAAQTAVTLGQTLAEAVPVQDALTQVSDALQPVADADPTGLARRIKDSVDLINGDLAITPLLTLAVGPARSDVRRVADVTTATGTAQGAVLVLSPSVLSTVTAPEGLVIVEVGAASATATTDAVTSGSSADPALVRIKVLDPASGEYDVVELAPGEDRCVLEDTPLQICLTAAASEATQGPGTATATANAVRVRLFAAPVPTVTLDLAATGASVAAAPPAPAPPSLPTTGGGAAAAGLFALAAGTWLWRRRGAGAG